MNRSRFLKNALQIGITIGLRTADEDLWINGIKQNALFLAKLLKNSPLKHKVVLLNTTDVEVSNHLPWDLNQFPLEAFDKDPDRFDVIIELGGQISAAQTERLKRRGGKLVSYCCGPEYIQNIEAMIFGRRLWDQIFINEHYDELWIIPQIWDLNRDFLQTFRKCPARQVPFVWDPMALEDVTKTMPNFGMYEPGTIAKRLSVIEPNIDVLKFCLYPILIAEKVFRKLPEKIGFLHVANATHMALAEREFTGLMHHLEIVKAHKASFIQRVRTPDFLNEYTDIVVSHQWGLPLNYFYLECCWQGYPLIHNAELIPDLGYYYPGHDLEAAAKQLAVAITSHDQHWQDYTQKQRKMIQRFLTTDTDLIDNYDALLGNLFDQKYELSEFDSFLCE